MTVLSPPYFLEDEQNHGTDEDVSEWHEEEPLLIDVQNAPSGPMIGTSLGSVAEENGKTSQDGVEYSLPSTSIVNSQSVLLKMGSKTK